MPIAQPLNKFSKVSDIKKRKPKRKITSKTKKAKTVPRTKKGKSGHGYGSY